MLENSSILQFIVVSYLAGSALSFVPRHGKLASVLIFVPSMTAAVFEIILSLGVLFGNPLKITITNSSFDLFGFDILVDNISAFFILVIGLVSFAVALYSIGYAKEYHKKKTSFGFLFNAFLLSMFLVVIANNVFSFLVFWEIMSLTSFFLVIFDHEKSENLKAGLLYLTMTHFGTAFIFGSFLLSSIQAGSFSFDSFRHLENSNSLIKNASFVFALIGFGTKAGMIPFHNWLPKAHPVAPSNVSALMSAVMLKVAVYGLIRIAFDFNTVTQEYVWWGVLITLIGAASSVIGVLYAVLENDIKKALAFSSIENIGIIFVGIGLAMVFNAYNLTSLAGLALTASMFHVLNHAIFKSLLFMGSGSILFSTKTKNMEFLGGLAKKMPYTSVLFLIGSLSIAGLPPFNGFVSEWLTLQAIMMSSQIPDVLLKVLLGIVILPVALTAGVAAVTAVKIFGISFLSRPRSDSASNAFEVPRTMIAGMTLLALFAISLGVLPFIGINLISLAFDIQAPQRGPFDSISIQNTSGESFASLSILSIVMLLGIVTIGTYLFIRILGKNTQRKIYETWDCGFGKLDQKTQYTAASLSQPIRTIFKFLYKPTLTVNREPHSQSNKFVKKSSSVESKTIDVFELWFYSPTTSFCIKFFEKIRRIQTGKVNAYLLYIMIALMLLLIFARFGS